VYPQLRYALAESLVIAEIAYHDSVDTGLDTNPDSVRLAAQPLAKVILAVP
jgi:hypothetical protein